MKQELGIRKQELGLRLVRKAVASVGVEGVREATTGRVVVMPPPRPVRLVVLPKVWAVAEETHVPEAGHGAPALVPAPADGVPAGSPAASVAAPEVAFYRKYTEAMLRRYMKMAMEAGRVPSFMGRELFRGNVTHCKVKNFEDVVIFCHDMEGFLRRLDPLERELVKRIALQYYSQGEAAAMIGITPKTCRVHYAKALDGLTTLLLECGMLEPAKCCQEAAKAQNGVSG